MNDLTPLKTGKFSDPETTLTGAARASVTLGTLKTLWFNTGTLCNIECGHCYIKSSPTDDRLAYLTLADCRPFLDELAALEPGPIEIGLTGGEPFVNPDCLAIIGAALAAGHSVLVLTNAMRPMQRPGVREALVRLRGAHGGRLVLRASLDHYTAHCHDRERGAGAWERTMAGLRWLARNGFVLHVAGRTVWGEGEAALRAGYAGLFAREGLPVDAHDPRQLVLFPEMDETADTPEITTACWEILGRRPEELMCASSRMIVKRRGAARPVVVACTLLPDDPRFELGETLAEARKTVRLNHPHCSRFCMLGAASCSG